MPSDPGRQADGEGLAAERTRLAHLRTALSTVALCVYVVRTSPALVVVVVLAAAITLVAIAAGRARHPTARRDRVLAAYAAVSVTTALATIAFML